MVDNSIYEGSSNRGATAFPMSLDSRLQRYTIGPSYFDDWEQMRKYKGSSIGCNREKCGKGNAKDR